jgi:hypothetical protein
VTSPRPDRPPVAARTSGDSPEVATPVGAHTAAMSTATATETAALLQGRARRLRSQAASLHPLLAAPYLRRAAELDVEALLEVVWNPPVDLGDGLPVDGPEGTVARGGRGHLAVA